MPQKHLTREQMIGLLLIVFALWCGISWRWYTCGVKGFCAVSTEKAVVEAREIPLIALAVAEAAPEVPPLKQPAPAPKNSLIPENRTPIVVTTPSIVINSPATKIEGLEVQKTQNCNTYINRKIGISTRNDPSLVSRLERFMNQVAGEPLAEDGMFGPNDIAAVKSYQRSQNLSPTGTVDQETAFYINRDVCSFPGSLLE